jgi:hypothetical protein
MSQSSGIFAPQSWYWHEPAFAEFSAMRFILAIRIIELIERNEGWGDVFADLAPNLGISPLKFDVHMRAFAVLDLFIHKRTRRHEGGPVQDHFSFGPALAHRLEVAE